MKDKIPCRCGQEGALCMIHNPPFQMKDKIIIPRDWLQRLIERADVIGELSQGTDTSKERLKACLVGLLGYIESAEELLK